MRILGIDPGLRITGYGAIAIDGRALRLIEAGVVEPRAADPLERRLADLHAALARIIATVQPDCVVIEELWTSYRNPATAVLMGHARGVACLAAGNAGIRVQHLAHALVKRALVGHGAARKEQVKKMVAQLLQLRTLPSPDDVSDALALSIAYAHVLDRSEALASAGVTRRPRRRPAGTALPPAIRAALGLTVE